MNEINLPSSATPDGIRIGTADRERAAAVLGEHFAAGRLEPDEFDERVRQVYAAKTVGELAPLFADLPGTVQQAAPVVAAAAPVRGRPRRGALRPAAVALLFAMTVAWIAVLHVPPFFLFPLVFFIVVRRGRYQRHAWAGRP